MRFTFGPCELLCFVKELFENIQNEVSHGRFQRLKVTFSWSPWMQPRISGEHLKEAQSHRHKTCPQRRPSSHLGAAKKIMPLVELQVKNTSVINTEICTENAT